MLLKFLSIVLFFGLISFNGIGQTIPVGTPILSEAMRNTQLLGQVDSSISFSVMPIFPIKAFRSGDQNDFYKTFVTDKWKNDNPTLRFLNNIGNLQLLPLKWNQQFNTNHPYSLNDGAMIPARGYQTMISLGFYAQLGILSIQFYPEYVYAENKDFQGLYKELPAKAWQEYNVFHSAIDFPEKFGNKPYNKFFFGQSSIRLTAGPISIGLSNENLWWGPGIKNSLLMSNTAPCFLHVTLNTVKPIHTFIGSFEGQIIGGLLNNSSYAPEKQSKSQYINGIVISYNPRWIPGLFLGLTRSEISLVNDLHKFKDYVTVLTPFLKKNIYGVNESENVNDQRLSVFSRWLLPKAHAEIYAEFFKEDHAYDFRDLFLQLEYAHAYLFGITKLLPRINHTDQFFKFQLEYTKIEDNSDNDWRTGGGEYLYIHYSRILQGYTNQGQLIGPGIGPGSDLLSVELSLIKGMKKIGLEMERFVHNADFFNRAIKDPRANWVDLNISAIGQINWKNLLFTSKLTFQNAYNYQYFYEPTIVDNKPNYWAPGTNTLNFQAQVAMTYRF